MGIMAASRRVSQRRLSEELTIVDYCINQHVTIVANEEHGGQGEAREGERGANGRGR